MHDKSSGNDGRSFHEKITDAFRVAHSNGRVAAAAAAAGCAINQSRLAGIIYRLIPIQSASIEFRAADCSDRQRRVTCFSAPTSGT